MFFSEILLGTLHKIGFSNTIFYIFTGFTRFYAFVASIHTAETVIAFLII